MKSICQTCGSPGWEGLLVACSKCRIACEHCYCMRENSFDASVDFVCADCSMRQVRKSIASDSIKAVPRSHIKNKVRVESSNPVPRWKKIPESSKMKLISPEEVKKLSSGGGVNKPPFKIPRPVPARCATSLTTQTVCIPRTRNLNSAVVARRTNSVLLPPKKPPTSPRNFQIRPGVIRQASKAQAVAEGSKSKVIDGAKCDGSKEICQSILSEKLLLLLPYRPALHPTWKGRIVHSASPSEFNGEFLAQPASKIHGNAYKLSKAIPVLLKVELVPIGNVLNDIFVNRSPGLSDVEIYIFPDDNNTKRFNKEEHAHNLFEAMKTRNAMIRINIQDKPLLIFSSKLLDKPSQIIIKMQKKTDNFLWGIFLLTKKSLAILPGTSSQPSGGDRDVIDKDTQAKFRDINHRNPGKQLQRQYRERG